MNSMTMSMLGIQRPRAGIVASASWCLQVSYMGTEDHCMSVRDLEPGGSPPGCSLPDLASLSAGAVPSVTLGCCHLAGAQISPQGVEEHGFGLLSGQIKAVSRASGRKLGLQISISTCPTTPPVSFVSCPPDNDSFFLSKSGPREGAAPKQLCTVMGREW